MSSPNIITDVNYNAAADALAIASAANAVQFLHCRCAAREKEQFMRNVALLGTSQSKLIRAFMRTPLSIQRACLESPSDKPFMLMVDTVSLSQGVNQIRRAGYNVDYTLHALNTLLAKPGLREERKLELLQQASDNSLAAAKHFMATREYFCRLSELAAFELELSRPSRCR